MNTIIEKLKAIIRLQIKRENLNFAALGGGGQTWNIETLEWVLKRLSDLEKEEKPMNVDEYELVRLPTDCEIHTGWVEERDGQGFVSVPANMFADGEEVIVIINRKN